MSKVTVVVLTKNEEKNASKHSEVINLLHKKCRSIQWTFSYGIFILFVSTGVNIHSTVFLCTQSSLNFSSIALNFYNTFLKKFTIYHISLYNRYSYSRHPFVKKNIKNCTFSYEKMQFLTFFLMNIICAHCSILQLHSECKIMNLKN